MMSVAELEPMPQNPRRISKRARRGLEESIRRFGLVQPIVWNRRTGHVVGGHQRLAVLKEQGVEEVDVVVLDLPESEERALNITLNNPYITGDWTDELPRILEELRLELPEVVLDLEMLPLDPWLEDEVFIEDVDPGLETNARPVWMMINTDEATAARIEAVLKSWIPDGSYRLELSNKRPEQAGR